MTVAATRRAQLMEIADRRAAIEAAVAATGPDDALLVLGKGHELGQEVAGQVIAFDDRAVVRAAIVASLAPSGRGVTRC
jgi:UDP-N-acetylmuramoyl-L-alanyl-D-glutamate--2,6-diaminopimelate ligase